MLAVHRLIISILLNSNNNIITRHRDHLLHRSPCMKVGRVAPTEDRLEMINTKMMYSQLLSIGVVDYHHPVAILLGEEEQAVVDHLRDTTINSSRTSIRVVLVVLVDLITTTILLRRLNTIINRRQGKDQQSNE